MATFVKNHLKPYEALTKFVESRPLVGKTILITGAGRGVGEHIARELAAAGASRIGIIGRDKTRIESAKDRFAVAYPSTKFEAFAADITDEAAIATVFQIFGVPDVLVNNAGHFPDDGPFITQDLRAWWSGFEINILGTATVTQKFLQAKTSGKSYIVINVSSMAAHMRFPLVAWSGYNGSKMGQARIFESLRFEHPDVRFLNIHPGQIDSDGFTRSGAPLPPDGMTDGKMAGQFYAWAATEEAAFLTGRFLWAEWDIEELKAKKDEILENDLLLTTIDGFNRGY
jgi:NADP-dependent 3-hydroxy acid dehydrogenase YdfG